MNEAFEFKSPPDRYWDIRADEPLVSVCVQAYQHKDYIRDCLDGILMQETNFPFELLLYDDASTDGTADICQEYANKYPGIIVPLFQKENQHSQGRNVFHWFQIPIARGKYIAICNGDDYWIDPEKLQKQVDALEDNHEAVCCHHKYIHYFQDQGRFENDHTPFRKIQTLYDMAGPAGCIPRTCCSMFRRQALEDIKMFINEFPIKDRPRCLYAARMGEFICLKDRMAVYREHSSGVWALKDDLHKCKVTVDICLKLLEFTDQGYFDEQFRASTEERLLFAFFRLCKAIAEEGVPYEMRQFFSRVPDDVACKLLEGVYNEMIRMQRGRGVVAQGMKVFRNALVGRCCIWFRRFEKPVKF